MSINTKEMNKPRISGDSNMNTDVKSPHSSSRKVNFEVDEYLNKLIQSGQGLNLTLFNQNPLKVDKDDEDME